MMKRLKDCPSWQETKRLSSGDRIWILTDVESYSSAFLAWSTPQQLFKVGAYDLKTNCIGFFTFSLDDVRGMLRAGLPPAPWAVPQPHGIEMSRLGHGDGNKEGRFVVNVKLVDVDPAILGVVPGAKKVFSDAGLSPNATRDIWKDLVASVAVEKKVEVAALGMIGLFSASDVQAIVGVEVNVSPVLKRLEKEWKLQRFGRTRGTKYLVR